MESLPEGDAGGNLTAMLILSDLIGEVGRSAPATPLGRSPFGHALTAVMWSMRGDSACRCSLRVGTRSAAPWICAGGSARLSLATYPRAYGKPCPFHVSCFDLNIVYTKMSGMTLLVILFPQILIESR